MMATESNHDRGIWSRPGRAGLLALGLVILGISLIVLLLLFLRAVLVEEESAGPDVGVALNDITDDPSEYYGSTVTVSGEIDEVIGARVFTIGGDDLLVLSADPLPRPAVRPAGASPNDDNIVQVTGLVREFDVDDFGQWIDAEDVDLFTPYRDRPVIVARSISLGPHAPSAGEPPVKVSVSDIADDPGEFYGDRVVVTSEINRVIGARAFTIGGEIAGIPPPEMLVVNAGGALPDLDEDQPVRVMGVVRQLDLTELERELGADVEDGLFGDWEDTPVIVAESIQEITTDEAVRDLIEVDD